MKKELSRTQVLAVRLVVRLHERDVSLPVVNPGKILTETANGLLQTTFTDGPPDLQLWKSRRLHRSQVAPIKTVEVHRASRPTVEGEIVDGLGPAGLRRY
jgi:hypothetical protein